MKIHAPLRDGYQVESCKQTLPKEIPKVVANKDVPGRDLDWVSRWLLDKTISKEKENYAFAFEELDTSSLPRDANIINSNHFFGVETDAETNKLQLKCRMVLHGSKDQDKNLVRKDFATAHFPATCLVLSTVAILGLNIGSLDTKSAYLQAGTLSRERPVYV